MQLTTLQDTYFKLSTRQSAELSDAEKIHIKKGATYEVLAHAADGAGHCRVTLSTNLQPQNRNTWWVWGGHVRIDGNEPNNTPHDSQTIGVGAIRLPGYQSLFYLDTPIIKGGNFTWSEATHGGTRIPETRDVVDRIMAVAKVMQMVREKFSRQITVTSWYRPPAINAAVGGASNSRHIYGDAVDFVVDGVHPRDVYVMLDNWWGSQGGLASTYSNAFTHIDCRGYMSRWQYGF